ncbi:MAG: type II toxin-antitoxin system prevent-host-death family antitoxin [Burkholderiaceae bacterium]|nr:type II toxin-antitoxin system prevent-host-death family antitoxin [Burkholderiaceae bacterium]
MYHATSLIKRLILIKLIRVCFFDSGGTRMEHFNASDVKREFGEALLKAQQGPVGINKNGKPVAVLVSARAYAELQALREKQLRAEIEAGIADIEAGRVRGGDTVISRLRKRIADA